MKRALPWLLPLAMMPLALLGLWLWRSQGAMIWFSGFISYCF